MTANLLRHDDRWWTDFCPYCDDPLRDGCCSEHGQVEMADEEWRALFRERWDDESWREFEGDRP